MSTQEQKREHKGDTKSTQGSTLDQAWDVVFTGKTGTLLSDPEQKKAWDELKKYTAEQNKKAREEMIDSMPYTPYMPGAKIKYNSLEDVTPDELKAVGIESMEVSPVIGPIDAFYVDRSEKHGVTLYARGRNIDDTMFADIQGKVSKLIASGSQLVTEFEKRGEGDFIGLLRIRKTDTLEEYVELDADYAMHDVKMIKCAGPTTAA